MVSILPSARTGMDVLGQYLGQGASAAMPHIFENQKRQMGLNAVDQLQASLQQKPGEPFDQANVLANLARVQALLPGFERSAFGEHVMKLAGARAEQNIPPPGGKGKANFSDMPQMPQRGPEVNFLNQQPNQNFPNVIGPQEAFGNAPQAATEGQVIPLRTPAQIRKDAIERQKASVGTAYPLTLKEAHADEVAEEEQKKLYNSEVKNESKERKSAQKEYGTTASDILKKAYPEASPKMLAMASKWGEDTSLKGKSEAEIKEHVIEKANKLANTIHNIKSSLSRPNVINNIERAADGSYKSFEQSAQDIRNHLKPLLDMGLYDEARALVSGLKYGPEERDMIINPLSQMGQSALNSLPSMTGTKSFRKFSKLPEGGINDIKSALVDLKKVDPNFSPLLARKYIEDRGYDWRVFKDAWNQLILEDESASPEAKAFPLTGDQKQMSGFLDTPPLTGLYKILGSISPELLPGGR